MADTNKITSSNPGRNGVFFRAPVGTVLPTDATTELDKAFKDQGIVGDDGVTQTLTRDTEDIKAYGGDTVYTLQTDYGVEFTATVYESTNVETLKTVFGDDNVVEEDGQITVKYNKTKLPRSTFVFDHLIDQGVKRQIIEIGQVTEVGDIVNVHTDIVKYELTIKAYPNPNGDYMVEYISTGEGEDALGIATGVLAPAKVGVPYRQNILAAGGAAPYTFEATGQLPEKFALTDEGVFAGVPTAAGTSTITVKVTDADGKSAQKSLSLLIQPEDADSNDVVGGGDADNGAETA